MTFRGPDSAGRYATPAHDPYDDAELKLPPRALPMFGRGAFRGSIAPSSQPDLDPRTVVTAPEQMPERWHIRPPAVTDFSVANKVRLGIPDMLDEWWRYLRRMSGAIFVSQARSSATLVVQSPPHVLGKLVPSRRSFYDPPSYGDDGTTTKGPAPLYAAPARRRTRR